MAKRKYDVSNGITGSLFAPPGAWEPPREFPNLSGAKTIGLDIETFDPELEARGPGFIRGNARVVGVSVAVADQGWYFPIGHLAGGNLSRDGVTAWLRDSITREDINIVGANLQYELEGLATDLGVELRGRMFDVQVAEALINEESIAGYELETLSLRYLGRGKDEGLLRQAADAYGVHPKSGLWKLHSKYVGAYATVDSMAPLQILQKQMEVLKAESLLGIFELECKLLPLLWEMRRTGIPVDLEAAGSLSAELLDSESLLRKRMLDEYGCKIDEWSGPCLAGLCDRLKIPYNRTPKGNPSFEGSFLESSTHPALRIVSEIRDLNRLRTTFIDQWIFKNHINGRVHPQWKQLKSDDGGTRTGRMAASNPNPQQVPGRSDLAPKVRALFRNPTGKWAKIDYSQQEPRLLVHFAELCNCTGAKLIAMAYRENPKMDIYQFLAESCRMKRRDAKDATLGRMYGMGANKFAMKQGIAKSEAQQKLDDFDRHAPFVREVSDIASNMANSRGYVKTLLGRRRHFNLWEPSRYSDNYEYSQPLPLEDAKLKWPGQSLRRYGAHKALNSVIQGSAADMTKAAMVAIWEQKKRVPYMAVHDELDFGVSTKEEALELKQICESCVELKVPIVAELMYGDHWK